MLLVLLVIGRVVVLTIFSFAQLFSLVLVCFHKTTGVGVAILNVSPNVRFSLQTEPVKNNFLSEVTKK